MRVYCLSCEFLTDLLLNFRSKQLTKMIDSMFFFIFNNLAAVTPPEANRRLLRSYPRVVLSRMVSSECFLAKDPGLDLPPESQDPTHTTAWQRLEGTLGRVDF